jgi:hypothetical protein
VAQVAFVEDEHPIAAAWFTSSLGDRLRSDGPPKDQRRRDLDLMIVMTTTRADVVFGTRNVDKTPPEWRRQSVATVVATATGVAGPSNRPT